MPVVAPSSSPGLRGQRAAQRLRLFAAALETWLAARGATGAQRDTARRGLGPALAAWAADAGGRSPDCLEAFAAFVASRPELSAWRTPDAGTPLAAAVARAVLAQATADVAREASRAGHADVFRALAPWVGKPLPADHARRLAGELGLPVVALERALTRLRRRWRQRIDAGLALCSPAGARRDALRARLHAALVDGETQP